MKLSLSPLSDQPLISVIIPTYNTAEFIPSTIRSVREQTYQNYEIIVADDGSTDDTKQKVIALGEPIHLLELAHTGRPARMRNQAIKQAQGQLIAFLDSDDIWRDDKLAEQVQVFIKDPSIGLVYSDAQFIFADGSISEPLLDSHEKNSFQSFENLMQSCFIHPSTVIVRRELFDHFGFFNERLISQSAYHFWLLAASVTTVRCIPEPLVLVRQLQESHSKRLKDQVFLDYIEVIEMIRDSMSLTWRQRFIARRSLSRMHTHLGIRTNRSKGSSSAQSFYWRSILLNPFQWKAWKELLRGYLARIFKVHY